MTKEYIDYPPRTAKTLQEKAEMGSDSYFRRVLKEEYMKQPKEDRSYDKKLSISIKKGRRFKPPIA
jgi:hypothetical protein